MAERNHEGDSDRFEKSRAALRAGVIAGVAFAGASHSASAQQNNCYYGVMINKPTFGQMFNFDSGNPVSVDIDFNATPIKQDTQTMSCAVAWTAMYSYTTSGGKGPFTSIDSFSTQTGQTLRRNTGSRGGQVMLAAQGQPTYPGNATSTIYVAGNMVASSDISGRLISLYTGVTANLMTGIAQTESTYQQFKTITLYGQSALWPNESYDGGSHVGLMQVPTNMANGFSWLANTSNGVNLFVNQKLPAGIRNENKIIATHTGLTGLTASQEEDMAIGLYGPGASGSLSRQVYVPVCVKGTVSGAQCSNGTWQWTLNVHGNPTAVNYVNTVRGNLQ